MIDDQTMNDSSTAIEFVNVTYRVDGNRTLISDLNLTIRRGETLMLLGRSGSGKTTTLKLINRLLQQSQGHVLVDGRSTSRVGRNPASPPYRLRHSGSRALSALHRQR